jgi:uncharacterized Zn finger protein (UPF0148 family)
MALQRGIDGSEPVRPQPIGRLAGDQEERKSGRTALLATGTLACPACDAPVFPASGALAPADPLGCPYCGHAAAVRDFLSLAAPSRPARVDVRVVQRT